MNDKSYTDFTTPRAIVENGSLAPKEKMELLSDWKQDVNRLMESTQENMAPHGYQTTKDGAVLRDIHLAIQALIDRTVTTEHYAR